jgi:hypothetical protein
LVPVVSVLVTVLVSGRVKVNVTEAPEAAAALCRTVAVIGTVEFVEYVGLGTERVAVNGGSGGITVALAYPVPVLPELCAEASTAYVAGAVPPGTDLVIVVEVDEDGDMAGALCEKAVGHAPGCEELMSKTRGAQPRESLLVTFTV